MQHASTGGLNPYKQAIDATSFNKGFSCLGVLNYITQESRNVHQKCDAFIKNAPLKLVPIYTQNAKSPQKQSSLEIPF